MNNNEEKLKSSIIQIDEEEKKINKEFEDEIDKITKNSVAKFKEGPENSSNLINSLLYHSSESFKLFSQTFNHQIFEVKKENNLLKEKISKLENNEWNASSENDYNSRPTTPKRNQQNFSTPNSPNNNTEYAVLEINLNRRISNLEREHREIIEVVNTIKHSNQQFDLKKNDYLKQLIFNKEFENEKIWKTSKNPKPHTMKKFFAPIENFIKSETSFKNINLDINPEKLKKSYSKYKFSERVIMQDKDINGWLHDIITIGKNENNTTFQNNFYTTKIDECFEEVKKNKEPSKTLFLGTGIGKSTFLVRCIASNNKKKGVTVVVPNSSLVESFLTSHNDWLAKGKDLKKDSLGNLIDDHSRRVTCCPICQKNHSKIKEGEKSAYKAVEKEKGTINIFTTWDFIASIFDEKKIANINEIVIFDEAHNDESWNDQTLKVFKEINRDLFNYQYKIIEMSATFQNLPSSGHLSGSISDNFVDFKSIDDFCEKKPEFLKKKIIVFCSKVDILNLSCLEEEGIEYLILNDQLKDHATEIVQSTNARIIIADSDYSLGFSFGDVNVISTSISSKKVIEKDKNENLHLEKVILQSRFHDLIQERGRCAREANHSGIWVCFTKSHSQNKKESNDVCIEAFKELRKNYKDYWRRKKENDQNSEPFLIPNSLKKIIDILSSSQKAEKKAIESLKKSEDKWKQYLKDILFKKLCRDLPEKVFSSYIEEKNKKINFEIKNDLFDLFNECDIKEKDNFLRSVLVSSVNNSIRECFEVDHEWAKRTIFDEEDEDYQDCFNFTNKNQAKKAIFLVSLKDQKVCKFEIKKNFNKETVLNINIEKEIIRKNEKMIFSPN